MQNRYNQPFLPTEDKRIEQLKSIFQFLDTKGDSLALMIANTFSAVGIDITVLAKYIQLNEEIKSLAPSDWVTRMTLVQINRLISIWLRAVRTAVEAHMAQGLSLDNINPNSELATIVTEAGLALYRAISASSIPVLSIDHKLKATQALQPSAPRLRGLFASKGGLIGFTRRLLGGEESEE